NRPVHWIRTTGHWPPSSRPAATARASPSRQTRTRRRSGSADRAGSHSPRTLSGIQTTWLTLLPLRAAATDGPSSMAAPSGRRGGRPLLLLLHGPVRLVAGHAGVLQLHVL